MNWTSEWGDDGTGVATHANGLQLRVTRSGWATVVECPPKISELQATVLMCELQRTLTDDESN